MAETQTTIVEGMTCGNCALSITRLLEKKGATNVSANAASGEVLFTPPDNTTVQKLYDAIEGLGYHVVREDDEQTNSHHAHTHTHGLSRNMLLLICMALTVPLLAHMFSNWHVLHNHWVQFALATPVYAIGCYVFGRSAFRSVKNGVPNMDVLIILGATAAYVYSIIGLVQGQHNYIFFETAASIITLVMVGSWLEHRTVKSTTVAIDALLELQPRMARLVMADSMGKESIMEVESKFVRMGDVVLVNNGDSVPVDGEIIKGDAQLDEHMITGESLPVHKAVGDAVIGGTLVADGHLRVRATQVGSASVLSGIIRMVREAQATKPALQKLADKISAIFVPTVLGIAIITLIINYFAVNLPFEQAMMRAIAVLVISCPCAMGLATPAAVAVGLGRAARNGILVKGGDTLEQLKKVKQIVFDKTGTLTTGKLEVTEITTSGIEETAFRGIVAALEENSTHPIARSISALWKGTDKPELTDIKEIKGKGIQATDAQGSTWQLGSESWLHEGKSDSAGYDLYLYQDSQYRGALRIADALRPDAKETITKLKEMGYKTILLSGDKQAKVTALAQELGIDEAHAQQTPEQKSAKLDALMALAPTAMVGDGINDAPALAKATVGISLSDATQIAIQSANIILSNNQLSTLPKAIRLGIYTEQTIKQNLFWAFLYNVIAIPVAAAGYLTPTWGAGIMALSDVVLVINSLRLGVRRLV